MKIFDISDRKYFTDSLQEMMVSTLYSTSLIVAFLTALRYHKELRSPTTPESKMRNVCKFGINLPSQLKSPAYLWLTLRFVL